MSLKIATFNVNGIRARLPIVLRWLGMHEPDVLCLQETKCADEQFPLEPFVDLGYFASIHGRKASSGVATFTRKTPAEVLLGFGDDNSDDYEARLISVKLGSLWVVNTYVPQGRSPDDPAFQYKLEFLRRLNRWFQSRFDPAEPLLWTGDINVAPDAIDVYDPKRMDGKVGFHPSERQALSDILTWGLSDLFRMHHPGAKQFTFWDYRIPGSFSKNLGWRLDHILVTNVLAAVSTECRVDVIPRSEEHPSDHTPVWGAFDFVI